MTLEVIFMLTFLCLLLWGQVREAIGVTLSVVCSNIRLYASFDRDHSHEGENRDVDNQLQEKSWVQFLIERASEVVMNIQQTNQADSLENKMNISYQNGHQNGDSQDDVKWMETVLIFGYFYNMEYSLPFKSFTDQFIFSLLCSFSISSSHL